MNFEEKNHIMTKAYVSKLSYDDILNEYANEKRKFMLLIDEFKIQNRLQSGLILQDNYGESQPLQEINVKRTVYLENSIIQVLLIGRREDR